MPRSSQPKPAFEIVGDPTGGGPFVFMCEHATNEMHGRPCSLDDEPLVEDHWGWDIGAAALTRALCERTGSAGVLSNFSRLLCDPNRPIDSASYIVTVAEQHAFSFNKDLDDDEIASRTRALYDAYHQAVDDTVRVRMKDPASVRLVSIHTFTPVWEGVRRPMEIGVLFDDHEPLARDLARALERAGFSVALNEPYSGRTGLIYSVQRHGRKHGLHHVEIEVRNDLLRSDPDVARIAERVSLALESYRPPNA